MRKIKDGSPAGYGRADRELATAIAKAPNAAAVDKIARDGGFKDADDAKNWLGERA